MVTAVGGRMPTPQCSVMKCFGSRAEEIHTRVQNEAKYRSTKLVWEAGCQHHKTREGKTDSTTPRCSTKQNAAALN